MDEFAVAVNSQDKRAEVRPLAVREAADEKLLLVADLYLEPAAASSRLVFGVGLFGHNSFQARLLRRLEHLFAVSSELVGDTEAVCGFHHRLQYFAPLRKWRLAEIVSVAVDNV